MNTEFEYMNRITEILQQVYETNKDSIKMLAEKFAENIMADKLIHTFGTGHSHMLGIELFARAGGLGNVDAMLDPDTLTAFGAVRSSLLEKTNGLSDIIYDNYNIDLLDDNGEVVNVSAYYSKSMTTDKTINQVDISGPYAYISTAFGIVQLNVAKAEISNSYNLDKNIVSTAVFGQYVYAALKDGGIWQGDTKKNILDKANWTACTDTCPSYWTEVVPLLARLVVMMTTPLVPRVP